MAQIYYLLPDCLKMVRNLFLFLRLFLLKIKQKNDFYN